MSGPTYSTDPDLCDAFDQMAERIETLTDERDRARRIAVRLEQELAAAAFAAQGWQAEQR